MPIPEKIIMPANRDPSDNHIAVSLVKSIFRIVGCGCLIYGGYMLEQFGLLFIAAGVIFALAEVLGIIEEIV